MASLCNYFRYTWCSLEYAGGLLRGDSEYCCKNIKVYRLAMVATIDVLTTKCLRNSVMVDKMLY